MPPARPNDCDAFPESCAVQPRDQRDLVHPAVEGVETRGLSDKILLCDGAEPASQPVTMKDLLATITHSLLDIGQVRLMPGVPQRVIEAMTKGEPIRGLV